MALERNPEVAAASREAGHGIACHGWRWIPYQDTDEAVEREHMARAVAAIETLTRERPLGWYTGRHSPDTHVACHRKRTHPFDPATAFA